MMENLKQYLQKKQKKFALGCDVDKEEVFNYPYLSDDSTVQFIQQHGHIMFIIRGPNSTMKATLSEMITERYPTAQLCCADHYFSKTFSAPRRTRETLRLSHEYCQKKVQTACQKNESPIIVQNTHMRKKELQIYLDLAALYNYNVIMSVTLYKFDVTPEALEKINPDGLNVRYFRMRLQQWEDVPPLLTGWFFCPGDVNFILQSLQTVLSALLNDAKFCRVFNSYDDNAVWNYFNGRRNIYCIAGYSYNTYMMKKYYLSHMVQESYGKSYFITIHGYLITTSGVMGIVGIEDEVSHLLFKERSDREDRIHEQFSSLDIHDNIAEYKSTIPFKHEYAISGKTAVLEDGAADAIELKKCHLIHIAQRKDEQFDIKAIKDKYFETLHSLTDDMQYTELENKIHICRLPNDEWFVSLPQKIKAKTLFTGLYI